MRAFSRRHLMAACAAIATVSIVSTGILSMTDDASAQSKPVTTSSGLQIIDTKAGTGASPESGPDRVMHYTGWLYDNGAKGKKFDCSVDRGQPFEFPIGAGPRDQGLGRGRRHDEGRRQAHADHPAGSRLWRARRRRRHSAERDADLRCRIARREVSEHHLSARYAALIAGALDTAVWARGG